jgi:hypothetical protein
MRLSAAVLSCPKAASRVSAKLWTPHVVSRDPPTVCVLAEDAIDFSSSSSLRMKKAVGTLDATPACPTLDLRDRGLTVDERASPPGSGLMIDSLREHAAAH